MRKKEAEKLLDEDTGYQFQYDEFNVLCDMNGSPCDKQQKRIAKNNPNLIIGNEYIA